MGLMSDLRDAAPSLDAQFHPTSNETAELLGSLVAYVEHGEAFLTAAAEGTDAVTDLVGEEAPPPEVTSPPLPDDPGKPGKPDKPKPGGK